MPQLREIFSKTRLRLKQKLRDISWKAGINHGFIKNSRGARILIYHGICRSDPLRYNTLFLTREIFENHLRFYKKYFNIVSLDDFFLERFSKERFNVCLSFDDGFANNYKYVLPLLEQYRIPAAFFITGIRDTGYDILWNDLLTIGGRHGPEKLVIRNEEFIRNHSGKYFSTLNKKPLATFLRSGNFENKTLVIESLHSQSSFKERADPDYWLQMNTGEIRKLASSPWVTIGSHGYYHNDLEKISIREASDEMKKSKLYLENLIEKEIKALAFPYGSYSREVVKEAKSTGYRQLLAASFRFPEDKTDNSMRERLTINPFISTINQMHATITGIYE